MAAVILFLLPVTNAIYAFRTDQKEDNVVISTAAGVTTANITLRKAIYDSDTSTLTMYSDNSTDIPLFSAYDNPTKTLLISGLSENLTRTMTLYYDYDSLNASTALDTVLDKLSWVWLICVICFVPAAIGAILLGRA